MDKKIKVMAMIWSMGNGGAQKVVLQNAIALHRDKDIEFKIYVFNPPTDSIYDRTIRKLCYDADGTVTYLGYPKSRIKTKFIRGPFNLSIARTAWADAIRREQPDIVHVHIDELLYEVLPGIEEADVPVRFDSLHSDPRRYKGRKLHLIRKAFQDDGFIALCLTNMQQGIAKEYYGFKHSEILRNGLDFDKIRSRIVSREESRKMLDIPAEAYVFACVGRLQPVKNYPFLIRLLPQLIRRKPKTLMIFAGEGEQLPELKKLAQSLGVMEHIRFIGQQSDVVPVYRAADVFCMSSTSESSPLVLLEAQACGCRCVISNGVPEESIITDRVCRMAADAAEEEWVTALLDDGFTGTHTLSEADYSLDFANKRLKSIYLKYWNEYNEKS